jgi:hypothetical protein
VRAPLPASEVDEAPAEPSEGSLRSHHDVLEFIGALIASVQADPDTTASQKARIVVSLVRMAQSAIDAADLETRLGALEAAIEEMKSS